MLAGPERPASKLRSRNRRLPPASGEHGEQTSIPKATLGSVSCKCFDLLPDGRGLTVSGVSPRGRFAAPEATNRYRAFPDPWRIQLRGWFWGRASFRHRDVGELDFRGFGCKFDDAPGVVPQQNDIAGERVAH